MDNPFRPTEKYGAGILLITFVSAFAGIGIFAYLDQHLDNPYLIASFGATAVLVFGAPKAPFSKPKNVFFGHFFSCVIGICIVIVAQAAGILDDYGWVACGVAVASAIVAMMLTGTIHPPGGATALTCVLACYDSFVYLFRPVMLGIVVIMIIAYAATGLKEKYGPSK